MMPFGIPVYLAHGALGYWDELIFLSVIVIFLVMMGVSWFRSRSDAFESDDVPALQRHRRSAPLPNQDESPASDAPAPTRFELD